MSTDGTVGCAIGVWAFMCPGPGLLVHQTGLRPWSGRPWGRQKPGRHRQKLIGTGQARQSLSGAVRAGDGPGGTRSPPGAGDACTDGTGARRVRGAAAWRRVVHRGQERTEAVAETAADAAIRR